jgi:putative transposase
MVYHVLNRGNNRQAIFRKSGDFAAFIKLLIEGKRHAHVDLLSYCLMSNHWHLVLIPNGDKDLAAYLSWVTNTHVKRYRAHHPNTSGHLYQGRYKSFVVEEDLHLLTLMRYVEANALRANLVADAQAWPWSSLGCDRDSGNSLLSPWPIDRPSNWVALVNRPLRDPDLEAIRTSIARGRPFGSENWMRRMCKRLGLEFTMRPRGRPRERK